MVRERGGAEIVVPPTINALLAARLDNLTREERAVVEPASVIGLVFAEAGGRGDGAATRSRRPSRDHLSDLDRKQFVHPAARRGRSALPVPPQPGSGCRLPESPEAGSGEPPRAIRGLGGAGQPRAWPRDRVRGDPRLPPRAGCPVSIGARAARCARAASWPRERRTSWGRPGGARTRPRRHASRREPLAAGDSPARPQTQPCGSSCEIELADVLLDDGDFTGSLAAINDAAEAAQRTGERSTGPLCRHRPPQPHALRKRRGTRTQRWSSPTCSRRSSGSRPRATSRACRTPAARSRAIHGTAGRYEEAAAADLRVIAASSQELGDSPGRATGCDRIRRVVAPWPDAGRRMPSGSARRSAWMWPGAGGPRRSFSASWASCSGDGRGIRRCPGAVGPGPGDVGRARSKRPAPCPRRSARPASRCWPTTRRRPRLLLARDLATSRQSANGTSDRRSRDSMRMRSSPSGRWIARQRLWSSPGTWRIPTTWRHRSCGARPREDAAKRRRGTRRTP